MQYAYVRPLLEMPDQAPQTSPDPFYWPEINDMQLFRILQSQGIGTRRECQDLVRRHQVLVNDVPVNDPEQEFQLVDLRFSVADVSFEYRAQAYLVMHKPAGYECSRMPRDHPSVFSLLPEYLLRRGAQCVGRLDQDTTGLLLFSDDGRFIHDHTSPRKHIGKTYLITCKHTFDESLIQHLLSGVQLHDEPHPVRAVECIGLTDKRLRLVIDEGKYHQVKRMVAAAGNGVDALHRLAVGRYALPEELAPGAWKWLETDDLLALKTSKPA